MRNKLAGKHPSYDRLNMSKEAIDNKKKYDSEYQKTKERKKYRAQLNKANRNAGTYGNNDGADMSHTKSGGLVMESMHKNRSRNGHNGRSSKK